MSFVVALFLLFFESSREEIKKRTDSLYHPSTVSFQITFLSGKMLQRARRYPGLYRKEQKHFPEEVKISIEILTILMNDLKGRCLAGSSVKLNSENSEDVNPLNLSL